MIAIDIPMPERCYDCPCSRVVYGEKQTWCRIMMRQGHTYEEATVEPFAPRPDKCPLQEVPDWNVLTEDADGVIHGLPGDDGQYLMTDSKDIWIDDYVDGVTDGIFLDSGRDIREITAWMYMPGLPKKDRW